MNKSAGARAKVKFVVVAALMMVALQAASMFIAQSQRQAEQPPPIKTPEIIAQQLEQTFFQYETIYDHPLAPVASARPVIDEPALEDMQDLALWLDIPDAIQTTINKQAKARALKVSRLPVYEAPRRVEGAPKIVIIIDDMGMDRKRSQAMIDLDPALTLAFLPYAPGVRSMAAQAKSQGHELMIHMPMQAMDENLSLGSIALRQGMSAAELEAQMRSAFEAFEDYAGMNNHMGSALTQDADAMASIMPLLKAKGLYFIDSKTIGHSVAGDVARAQGLPAADRDVFLDHVNTLEFVREALREVEAIAERKGIAIAIGHPKSVTIEGLKEWLPQARARGFEIVPASRAVGRAAYAAKRMEAPQDRIVMQKPEKTLEKVIETEAAPQFIITIDPPELGSGVFDR